jgi:hypothetical protein
MTMVSILGMGAGRFGAISGCTGNFGAGCVWVAEASAAAAATAASGFGASAAGSRTLATTTAATKPRNAPHTIMPNLFSGITDLHAKNRERGTKAPNERELVVLSVIPHPPFRVVPPVDP